MVFSLFKKKSTRLADQIEKESESESVDTQSILNPATESKEESLYDRLKRGLSRTSGGLVASLRGVFGQGAGHEEILEEIEAILIQADLGVKTTQRLLDQVRPLVETNQIRDSTALIEKLRELIHKQMSLHISPLKLNEQPFSVVLIAGINGVGKTTTTAKIGNLLKSTGKKCMFAACDTFRAGAVEQLGIWGERLNIPVITGSEGQDPASVAFEAMKQAQKADIDVLLIDTAGRLHTQKNLMEELGKIQRVIQKNMPSAPHEIFLVLDSTTGQNAIHQARMFHEMLKLTGLVMTKLDGTAKGGVVFGIQEELGLPIRFVGVGEKFTDLQPFDPQSYSQALFEEN